MISAVMSNATHYEISIYATTPISFWLGVVLIVLIGIACVFYSLRSQNNIGYYLAIILFIFSNCLVMFLPYLRGYPIYGGADHLFHLESINQVIISGNIAIENFYPSIHVMLSTICLITNSSYLSSQYISPLIFGILFPLICFILGRVIGGSIFTGSISCLLSCMLIFNSLSVMIYPFIFSILFVAIFLVLVLKTISMHEYRKISFTIVIMIIVIAIILSHPIGVVVSIAVSMTITLSSQSKNNLALRNYHLIYAGLISLILFVWLFSKAVLEVAIESFYYSINNPFSIFGRRIIGEIGENLGIVDSLILFIKLYSDTLLIIILALCSISYLLRINNNKSIEYKYSILLLSILLAIFLAQILSFFQGRETPGRFLNGAFFPILAIPIGSIIVSKFMKSRKRIISLSCLGLILCTLISSYSAIYHSSYVNQASWMITSDNIAASEWIETNIIGAASFACLGIEMIDKRVNFTISPHFENIIDQNISMRHSLPWYFFIGSRAIEVSKDSILSNKSINHIDGPKFFPTDYQFIRNMSGINQIGDFGGTLIYIFKEN